MTKITLNVQDHIFPFEVEGEAVLLGRKKYRCLIEQRGTVYHTIVKGKRYRIEIKEIGVGKYEILLDGEKKIVYWEERRGKFPLAHKGPVKKGAREIEIVAPMPGRIVKVYVQENDTVPAGALLLSLEAMKMENAITTNIGGKVKALKTREGETVKAGQVLVIIKEEA